MKTRFLIIQLILLGLFSCSPPPPPDLVGWWSMDETSGSVANDIKSAMNGTIQFNPGVTSTSFVPGKVSGCFHYSNSANNIERVIIPHNQNLNFGTSSDFTIDAWVGFDNTNYNEETKALQGALIFCKLQPNSSPGSPGYIFKINGLLKLSLRLAGGGSIVRDFDSQSSIGNPTGQNGPIIWTHALVRVERNPTTGSGVTFFINGEPDLCSCSPGRTNNINIDNDYQAEIGWVGESFKNMYLDEVEVFNRALTNSEIKQIVEKGKSKIWISK
jgi:hypothetical protein